MLQTKKALRWRLQCRCGLNVGGYTDNKEAVDDANDHEWAHGAGHTTTITPYIDTVEDTQKETTEE